MQNQVLAGSLGLHLPASTNWCQRVLWNMSCRWPCHCHIARAYTWWEGTRRTI